MEIAYFVLLNALGHLAFVGARMTTTLFALQLGASEAAVGVLMSLFALLPAFLSISAGRLIDRVGSRLVLHDGPYPIDTPAGLEAWAAAIERWTEAVTMLRAYLDFFVDLRPRW